MKKVFLLLASLSCLTLSACDLGFGNDSQDECVNHIDEDHNGFCDNCGYELPRGQMNFIGITFSNQTFNYDGQSHSIFVTGAPDFAHVTYTGNGKIDVGVYTVKATITADNYKTLNLTAKMTITGNTFTGITFKDKTINYDGQSHSIYVTGAPDFATVTYTGNNQKNVGNHKVTATVKASGYSDLTLSAYLNIKALKFTGITFEDKFFEYDGYTHSIFVSDAPAFADVNYNGNQQYSRGTYTVTATIKATGYETLILTAKMTIGTIIPEAIISDGTFIYDGRDHKIPFSIPSNVPRYCDISFKVDGKTITEEDKFVVKTVGTHNVSITISHTDAGYQSSTAKAKIYVLQNNFAGVDLNKIPLTIDNNLKYQTLRSKILEGNFTLKVENMDDYFYPDGTEKHQLSSTDMYYSVDGEMLHYHFNADKEDVPAEQYFRHTKIIGDKLKSAYFEEGVLTLSSWEDSYTLPASLYKENFVGRIGLKAMCYLKEAADGGFENSEVGGYRTSYGSFAIDAENNVFVQEQILHYYHPEFDHDEHFRYSIYNIGNTTINVPDTLNASKVNIDFDEGNSFYSNGFRFSLSNTYATMYTVIDAISKAYLEPGTHIIPAYIADLPVLRFTTSYYDKYIYNEDTNNDCSCYTFKTYFDKYGNYCGQYESLGQIGDFYEFDVLVNDSANILYFGEW